MKNFFIGCLKLLAIIFLLLVAAFGFFYYKYGKVMTEANKMPEIIKNPTVLIGEGFFKKNVVLEDNRLGAVSDIVVGALPETRIGIVGLKGVVSLDSNYKVLSSISFGGRMSHVDAVDIEGDGQVEFMNRGSWGEDAAIYNDDGKQRWTYGGRSAVNDMSAGNFDNDKQKEFVVGFNGRGGVHLIDENGKQLWEEKDVNVWHVEAVDIDNDGISEIIHSNVMGGITVRNAKGKVIKQSTTQSYFAKFSMLAPLFRDIVLAKDDHIWLFDFDGNVIKEFDAPDVGQMGVPLGTMVEFDKKVPKHYAFSVSYKNWKKCSVYVYDNEGNLQYHEVLDEQCQAIAAIPDSANSESLLIGGNSRVLKYTQ